MAEEFKVISTQEEFDAAVKSRLARERASVEKQYADYEELKATVAKFNEAKKSTEDQWSAKLAEMQKTVNEANDKIKAYEMSALKEKIAREVGLPIELKDRISGANEEELKADAKALQEVVSAQNRKGLPGFKAEEVEGDPKTAAYRELLSKLKKE